MKRLLSLSILLVFVLAGSYNAFGTKCVGQEITYQSTATPNIYSVTVNIYRKCGSDPICVNCQSNCSIKIYASGASLVYTGVVYDSATLYLDTITGAQDAIALCSGVKSVCTNCGQRPAGSFSPGIEKLTFKGLINISHVPTASCLVSFNTGYTWQRETSNNLSTTNPVFYSESILNRCIAPNNSSPTFYTDALLYNISGQDVTYNIGAFDADGDSLFYGWVPALNFPNTTLTYSSPYSYTAPFPYLGAPITSPPALPPSGINLNIITGHLIYRPMLAFEAAICLEVKEFRKFGNVYVPIATSRRDVNLSIGQQAANLPPIIQTYSPDNTPSTFVALNTCPNQQVCFKIAAFESGSDTIDLSIDMPEIMRNSGATLTHLYNGSNRQKFDSAQFCWTPPSHARRDYPYYLSIVAKDRVCPVNGTTRKIAYIRVNNQVNFGISKKQNTNASWNFTCETSNKAAIRFNLNQFKIETNPGSGMYNTLIADSVINYVLPTTGWYKLQLTCTGFNGCVVTQNDSVYFGPPQISLIQQTNLKCSNDSNASVELFYPSSASVQYKIDSGNWQSARIITQLRIGNHKAYVREGLMIKDSININITSTFNHPILSGVLSKKVNCASSTNGEITLQANNGIMPYQYKLLGSFFQNNPIFGSLNLGEYAFQCKDSVGCMSAPISMMVTKVDSSIYKQPLLSATQTQQVFCNKPTQGIIQAMGTLGLSPYKYSLNNGSYQVGNLFQQLSAGVYSLSLKDSIGCLSDTIQVTIQLTPKADSIQYQPTLGIMNVKDVNCYGQASGQITLSANGGAAPYQYKLGNGNYFNNSLFIQLAKGWHTFYMKDSKGCESDSITAYINGPDTALGLTFAKTSSPLCYGLTGKIEVGIIGGRKPYYVFVNNKTDSVPEWSSTNIIDSAFAGFYQISVGDSLGCLANTYVGSNRIQLNQPEKIASSFAIISESCPGTKNGQVYFSPRGGISPYYLYNQKDSLLPGLNLGNLGMGYVTFTIRDSNQCKYQDSVYVNLEPVPAPDQICKLTLDTATKEVLLFIDKTPSSLIASYKIFNRENNTQVYNQIGEITYDSIMPFRVPTPASSAIQMQYMVLTYDYCGRYSSESMVHQPLFIQQTSGSGNWIQRRNYIGQAGGVYQMFRSNENGPFIAIGTQLENQTIFHDQNPPTGSNKYFVRYFAPFICQPLVDSVESNVLAISNTGIGSNIKPNFSESIYPNPSNGKFYLTSSKKVEKIEVFNLAGEKILSTDESSFNLETQAQGLYFVRVYYKEGISLHKVEKLP